MATKKPPGIDKLPKGQREAEELTWIIQQKLKRHAKVLEGVKVKGGKLTNKAGEILSFSQMKHTLRGLGSIKISNPEYYAELAQNLIDGKASDKEVYLAIRSLHERGLKLKRVLETDQLHHGVPSNVFRSTLNKVDDVSVIRGGLNIVKDRLGWDFGEQAFKQSLDRRSHLGTTDPIVEAYSNLLNPGNPAFSAHPTELGGTTSNKLLKEVALAGKGKKFETAEELADVLTPTAAKLQQADTLGTAIDESRRGPLREFAKSVEGLPPGYDPFNPANTQEQIETFRKAAKNNPKLLKETAGRWKLPKQALKIINNPAVKRGAALTALGGGLAFSTLALPARAQEVKDNPKDNWLKFQYQLDKAGVALDAVAAGGTAAAPVTGGFSLIPAAGAEAASLVTGGLSAGMDATRYLKSKKGRQDIKQGWTNTKVFAKNILDKHLSNSEY